MKQSRSRFILKDSVYEAKLFKSRIILAWFCMVLGLAVIVARLFFLQVVNHSNYTKLSEKNYIKVLPLPPTRGLIYDRRGVLLAGNRSAYSLQVTPEKVKDIDKMLTQLNQIIPLGEDDIARFKRQLKQIHPFDTIPLRFHLNEDEVARFSVQRHRFPGLDITSDLTRYYPLGSIGVHIIGYVGRINEEELKTIDPINYQGSNYIGKIGVEKYYEEELHGQAGYQHVETNVQGRILRILERKTSVSGQNLYLNVDMALQAYTEEIVKNERSAVVAIEPDTGAVLAMVSMPNYDPNLFVQGISTKEYAALRDSPDRPLFNRAVRGQYPPGSTVKAFVGLAGLEYGVRTEHSATWCRGWYRLKGQEHKYRDWKKSGHGSINLYHAIEQSCDVYFYDLAHDLGIDRLHEFMTRFTFGQKTGVDLRGELGGLMPSREWKQRVRKRDWYGGDTVITGIGQGYSLSTPLQLAVATAILASRGQFKQPRLAFALDDPNTGEMRTVDSAPQPPVVLKQESFWDIAISGMEAVVHNGRGTAKHIGRRSRYRFAGKTGTAQVVGIKQEERYDAKKLAKKFHDHALFIAFAPLENPRIAVSVIIENGGSGGRTAAPIAKKVMDAYLLPNSPLTRYELPPAYENELE